MEQAIKQFEKNIERVYNLVDIYAKLPIEEKDCSDILRAALVLLVSALDTFIHDIVRLGMIEILQKKRPSTNEYKKLTIDFGYIVFDPKYEWFEAYVRRFLHGDAKKSGKTYQEPDRIAEGIELISNIKLWDILDLELGDSKKLKKRLREIIRRRNTIAHESDINPSYPNLRNPINLEEVKDSVIFIEQLVKAIYRIVINN